MRNCQSKTNCSPGWMLVNCQLWLTIPIGTISSDCYCSCYCPTDNCIRTARIQQQSELSKKCRSSQSVTTCHVDINTENRGRFCFQKVLVLLSEIFEALIPDPSCTAKKKKKNNIFPARLECRAKSEAYLAFYIEKLELYIEGHRADPLSYPRSSAAWVNSCGMVRQVINCKWLPPEHGLEMMAVSSPLG